MTDEGRTPVARRQVFMNEILEMIYQWHNGAGAKGISQSLGFDRDTVRKYVRLAQRAGVDRAKPLPEDPELTSKIQELMDSAPRKTPAKDLIHPHRQWLESLLHEPHMTAKQAWKLFEERTALRVGYRESFTK